MEIISTLVYIVLSFGVPVKYISIAMMSTPEITFRLVLPDTVQVNSQVIGSLEITNKDNEKIELVSPNYNAALNLVVFDSFWNEVSANSLGKAHIAYERFELLSGQTINFELVDLTFTTGTSRMCYKLKSGTYYILAIYHPGTTKLPEQSSYPVAKTSNVKKLVVI